MTEFTYLANNVSMLLGEPRTRRCRHCAGTGKEVNHSILGKRLKKIRSKSGLSLREIAERLGFSHVYVYELELGRRNWSKNLISDYLKACRRKS